MSMSYAACFLALIAGVALATDHPGRGQTDSEQNKFSPCPFHDSHVKNLKKINYNMNMNFSVSEYIPGLDDTSLNCEEVPATCAQTRYRSINGSCNNLQRPGWGVPHSAYGRLIKNTYGDGIYTLPTTVSGDSLPNVRLLSLLFSPDMQLYDLNLSLLAQQWGQVIAHELSLLDDATITGNLGDGLCCINGKLASDASSRPRCAPMMRPPNDPLYEPDSCMNLVRSLTPRDIGCAPEDVPAEQISIVTSYMDASLVYGNNDSEAQSLRVFSGGLLKTDTKNGRKWPPQASDVTKVCPFAKAYEACYVTGDSRANQSPQLAILQIVLHLEHNRIAQELSEINPHWDDETIYQEARRIVIAEVQYINYYEYLPILLGYDNMVKYKLIYPNEDGFIDDYDPNINAAALNEFATAAYRFPHAMIRGQLELTKEDRQTAGYARLSDHLNRPQILEEDDNFDDLLRGCTKQESSKSDQYFDIETTQYLFRGSNTYGTDLRAKDLQRARDHGIGSYIAARAACQLPVPKTFEDLSGLISSDNIELLQETYNDIEDVDLAMAGALEKQVPDTLFGPTFLCISMKQFYRTRVGDRFFFENGQDKNIAFSLSQLQSIRNATMARILCDNSEVLTMQPEAFKQITDNNSPIPCEDLPAIDLNLWKERNSDE